MIIYIPLCFYFIDKLSGIGTALTVFTFHYASTLSVVDGKPYLSLPSIYIPLCFYFIVVGSEHIERVDAIYIPLCFYFILFADRLVVLVNQFTFHYASTLSLPTPPQVDDYYNLHSTMLLLYRRKQGNLPGMHRHLHSTMLLLYPVCGMDDGIPDWNLHSTMLLLYLQRYRDPRSSMLNLHSTMLLLYPVPLFPFYFLQYGDTFCLPPFFIALLSKIFLLPLYKI